MAMPLGVVQDVAVGSSGVVYFLDTTSRNIRRITLSGELLSPMGRPGTGPGDLSQPLRMAVLSDDRCVVIEDFSKHATCFTADGDACEPWDISSILRGYASTIFLRAAAGPHGELIIAAVSNKRRAATPDASLEELGTSAWVQRLRPGKDDPEKLFATVAEASDSNVVSIPADRRTYVIHCWDINAAGEILYADPSGEYRVYIGHPADGAVKEVEPPEMAGDDGKVRELVKMIGGGLRADDVPRIAKLHWLDNTFFAVTPAAELKPPARGDVGTVEVFRRDGSSYGRYTIQCEYDPDNDEVFTRGDILVVVRGGKSVARAAFHDFLPPPEEGSSPPAEVYEIRVQAYRLFSSLRT
jgi:hypothetical protein